MKRFLVAFAQVLAYLLLIFVIIALLVIPTHLIFGYLDSIEQRYQILILGLHMVLAAGIISTIMLGWRKAAVFKSGWPNALLSIRSFAIGALMGFLLSAFIVLIISITGGGNFNFQFERFSEYLRYIIPLIVFLFIAALGEEWIFRGYPLSRLSQAINPSMANVLVSLLFMAGHWGGSGWNVISATNIFLFSMLLGALRFTRGGIPLAWGFHFTWNSFYVMTGTALSGEKFAVPFIDFINTGPVWLSGGLYGPEGSIVASFSLVMAIISIQRYLKFRPLNKELEDKRLSR
jgi:membrane protease YdiL (CAAX protease family)